jgi:hypothetical protein
MIFNMFKNNPNISWAFTSVGPKFHFEIGIIRWTNAMWAHLLLRYTHQVHIKYIIYIYKLFFLNQYSCMLAIHIQGYVNLRNYSSFGYM